MINYPNESFLKQYLKDLEKLENDFNEFAEEYPNLAPNLGFGKDGTTDPHVKQLIEAVAFISSRLQRQIESIPNQIVHNLIRKTDKLLCEPIPSMSVASFNPISKKLKFKESKAPKKWTLYTKTDSNTKSIKYTSYFQKVKLLPLETVCEEQKIIRLEGAEKIETNCFIIKINALQNEVDLSGVRNLDFYISGALSKALEAIDSIFLGLKKIYITDRHGNFISMIGKNNICLRNIEEININVSSEGEKINKMIYDLLYHKELYSFFTIKNLELTNIYSEFHIVMEMDEAWHGFLMTVADNIKINCIPIVNKYSIQPISKNINQYHHDYELVLDNKKDEHIFGIEKIVLMGDDNEKEIYEYNPIIDSSTDVSIYWNMMGVSDNFGRYVGNKFILQILGDNKKIANYKSILIYCQVTQGFHPESLNSGVELKTNNWDSGYKSKLECLNTKYVAPLNAEEINNFNMLLGVKSNINHDALIDEVVKYINSRDRFNGKRSKSINDLVLGLDKKIIACKNSNSPVGTMLSVGVMYKLILKKKKDEVISYVVLAKIIMEILKAFNKRYDSVFMSLMFEDQKREYLIS